MVRNTLGKESSLHKEFSGQSFRILVEGSISVALAMILSFIRIYQMPQGGEVSLEMIPLITFAILRGPVPGFISGISYGLLHFIMSPFVIHPVQFLLDYPLAYGSAGLSGLFFQKPNTSIYLIYVSILLSMTGRFIFHVISGVIFISFFIKNTPHSPLNYSILYNASYIVPDTVICFLIIPLLVKRVEKNLK